MVHGAGALPQKGPLFARLRATQMREAPAQHLRAILSLDHGAELSFSNFPETKLVHQSFDRFRVHIGLLRRLIGPAKLISNCLGPPGPPFW